MGDALTEPDREHPVSTPHRFGGQRADDRAGPLHRHVLDRQPDRALSRDPHVREHGGSLRIGDIGDLRLPSVSAQPLPERQRPVVGGLGARLTGFAVDQQPRLTGRRRAEVGVEDLRQTLVAQREPDRARRGSGGAESLFVGGQGNDVGGSADDRCHHEEQEHDQGQ
jgi:hypothetical protein